MLQARAALPTLDSHQLLVLLLQLCVLGAMALLLGRLARRLHLPAVVGELCAGVTGAHLDTTVLRRRPGTVLRVAAGAFVIPLGLGVFAGYTLPGVMLGDPAHRDRFALFLGVAMAVSAIPVIAKTLLDMGLIHRDIGQLILAAGMLDDVAGWLVLSVAAAMAASTAGATGLLVPLLGLMLFVAFGALVGVPLIRLAARRTAEAPGGDGTIMGIAAMTVLLGAAITQTLGLEAAFGAFVGGLVLAVADSRLAARLAPLRAVVLSVLAPIFFASAGLRIDLSALAHPAVALAALAVLLLAVLGKFLGAGLGALLSRKNRWECLAVGAGLNARGVIEIVVATVGLRLHIISGTAYTVIILVAIVTSVMAAPILRFATARLRQTDEERLRGELLDVGDEIPGPAVPR
jgi:Kef-type K+ transport system membrane component KefB